MISDLRLISFQVIFQDILLCANELLCLDFLGTCLEIMSTKQWYHNSVMK